MILSVITVVSVMAAINKPVECKDFPSTSLATSEADSEMLHFISVDFYTETPVIWGWGRSTRNSYINVII